MPKNQGFASQSQWRKCFAMKRKGQAKGWDCHKWAHEAKDGGHSFESLPKKKGTPKGGRKKP